MSASVSNLLEKYVLSGGPVMWVLIPTSVVMVAAVVQGWLRISHGAVVPRRVLRAAERGGAELDAVLDRDRSPLAEALRRLRAGAALDAVVADLTDDLRDSLGTLATIFTIAPLLGLVGTVLAMMHTFEQFAAAPDPSLRLISIGVQEALVTTLWGLAIAIPAYVVYQWLHGRINRYERELLPAAIGQATGAGVAPAGGDASR